MSKLHSEFRIKDISFRNRIVVSPMCQYSSVDGFANDWHLVHLGSRAVGGAALIIQEATAVSPHGRISPQDMGLWKDEHIEKLKSIVSFIHSQGAVAGVQLAHAGRKGSTRRPWEGAKQLKSGEPDGWQTVAPSAIAFNDGDEAPHPLTKAELVEVIESFGLAASRAMKAGYKILEIHAAHGYLIHQFLSPLSNQRTDEFGGSFENRVSLLLAIVDRVKTFWPATFPLFVRISATDWAEGGWNIDESVKLAVLLKAKGVDLIDCSSGGLVPHVKIPIGPGYQVDFFKTYQK